jgi:hypothetical protein
MVVRYVSCSPTISDKKFILKLRHLEEKAGDSIDVHDFFFEGGGERRKSIYKDKEAVLGIYDILVWIRIPGSVPLTYLSDFFLH